MVKTLALAFHYKNLYGFCMGMGLIPDWEAKFSDTTWYSLKKIGVAIFLECLFPFPQSFL